MIKILFVCHGNICRSPMAEFVMKEIVKRNNVSNIFKIESCATSREEIGNGVYPPAKQKLAEYGISCKGKTARQMTKGDYEQFDYIVAMDSFNLRNMMPFTDGDKDKKVYLLMDFTDNPRDVADPWYTGDFEKTWQDVTKGCEGLFAQISLKYNL